MGGGEREIFWVRIDSRMIGKRQQTRSFKMAMNRME
jgi:hypothetical protein